MARDRGYWSWLVVAFAGLCAAPATVAADDSPTTVAEASGPDAGRGSETIKRSAREVGEAVKQDVKVVGEAAKRDAKVVGKAVAESAKATAKVVTEDAKKVGKAAHAGAASAKNSFGSEKSEKSGGAPPP